MEGERTASKKISKLKNVLMKAVVNLSNLNIPSHIIYFEKKQISHFGTQNAMEKFEKSSSCKCKCECDAKDDITWVDALKEDRENLSKTGGSVFDQDKIEKLGMSNYFSSLQKIKKLDAPLSVARYEEITNYLGYLIRLEAQERGVKEKGNITGEEMRPIHCWIEEDFPWSQFRNRFRVKSSEYPGPGKLIDFYRRCVQKGLEARGIDPEKHYSDELTDEELRKRRKRKGLEVEETQQDDEEEPEKKRLKDYEHEKRKPLHENHENSIDNIVNDALVDIKIENKYDDSYQDQNAFISLSPVQKRFGDELVQSNEIVQNDDGEFLSEISSGLNFESSTQEYHDRKYISFESRFNAQPTKMIDQEKIYHDFRIDFDTMASNKTHVQPYDNEVHDRETDNSQSRLFSNNKMQLIDKDNCSSNPNFKSKLSRVTTAQKTNQEVNVSDFISELTLPSEQTSQPKDQKSQECGFDDIGKFFTLISLPELSNLFIREDVTMDMLCEMSGEDLKEIGVSKFGQRFKILKSVKSRQK